MANPKISLITPTKNRANLIGKMIESVISQTFRDWELIIIDDGSTDNTKEIVAKYSSKDPRISYYSLPAGSGPGAARNYGVQKATSDLICISDSDDLSLPERLEETVRELEKTGVDVVYGNLQITNMDNGEEQIRKSSDFSLDLLKRVNIVPNPTAAFRKSVFVENGGYDQDLRTSEDYDLWLKLALSGRKFLHIDKILVHMYVHPGSTTKSTAAEIRKDNLRKVRQRYGLPTPTMPDTLQLMNDEIRKIYSTEGARFFWFTD